MTEEEFTDMIKEISLRCRLKVRSVFLPPGMTMDDPALKVTQKAGVKMTIDTLEPGETPEFPVGPYVADVAKDLISPDWNPDGAAGALVRAQVIPESLLAAAENNASEAYANGKGDALDFPLSQPVYSPRSGSSHRKCSAYVQEQEHHMSRNALKNSNSRKSKTAH